MTATKLVIGSTRGIDGLDVDIRRGDLVDPDSVRAATPDAISAAAHFRRTSRRTRTEHR